jgi:hypothetical protein
MEAIEAKSHGFWADLRGGLSGLLGAGVQPVASRCEIPTDPPRAAEPTCCFTLTCLHDGAAPQYAGQLEFSPELADILIDLLLGGAAQGANPGPPPSPRGTLTALDRHILRPVVELACQALARALDRGPAVTLAPAGEQPPEAVASAVDLLAELGIRHGRGAIRVSLAPAILGAMAPLADLAPAQSAPPEGQAQLCARIEESVSADEVARLKSGDILVTDVPAQGEVIVEVDGKPAFAAHLGQYNGHRALTITRKLQP